MEKFAVRIMPENITVWAEQNESLLTVVRKAGIVVESPCGGQGTCGKCAVRILEGSAETGSDSHISKSLRDEGYIPACMTRATGDITLEVPSFSRLTRHQVLLSDARSGGTLFRYLYKKPLNPMCRKLRLVIGKPSLTDNLNDLDRLKKAIAEQYGIGDVKAGLHILKQLPGILREGCFEITAYLAYTDGKAEIIRIEPGLSHAPSYGLAVDVGTTTVVVELVDTEDAKVVSRAGAYNMQCAYGSDVISRIVFSDEHPEGVQLLQKAIVDTVNGLIGQVLESTGTGPDEIPALVLAGNTVMTQMLMGVPATWLRLEPYVPAVIRYPAVRARELGLAINPEACITAMPSVASYVGGDISSGVLYTGLADSEELALFIDIGTNGEIVLGNSDWMMTCACSAGPAFEGSGITCGMRAMDGAVDRIEIEAGSWAVSCRTVGDAPPLGICGSGLIYAMSEMKDAGIIDRAGKMHVREDCGCVRQGPDGLEFVIAPAVESGSGNDIVITEADVKNLLRAKGAIFAGIRTMLELARLNINDIGKVYIAGGFGSYINIVDAVKIGMLPDLPADRFLYVGNSSIRGAITALLCREAYDEAGALAENMTYLELSQGNMFMDEFISALFIPHTDLGLFPTVGK